MFITKLALPRRTFLRGVGATVALPFLDAMVPALSGQSKSAPRFAVVYVGNGANMAQWTPTTDGVDFEMTPILKGIEAYRDRMAVFTGTRQLPGNRPGRRWGAAPARRTGLHERNACESDGRRRPPGRHDHRPDHRRRDLPRHEASVIGNDGRSHRRRRRLRPRLRMRVHELYVVENPDDAAAG